METNETALVIVPETSQLRLGSLAVSNPTTVIVQASGIATELKNIIRDRHLSREISGREYVYVDGWSTMGAMLGVVAQEVQGLTHEFENGDWEATVELVRMSDGAVIGRGSAILGLDERDRNGNSTWGTRPRYARRSMAITRATGKAFRLAFSWIMSLAGYATTPAEEMDGLTTEGEYRVLPKTPTPPTNAPLCPICHGAMYDNREKVAAGGKGPEWSCKNAGKWNPATKSREGCAGVYWAGEWPPKPPAESPAEREQLAASTAPAPKQTVTIYDDGQHDPDADFSALTGAQDETKITDKQRKQIFAMADKVYGRDHLDEFRAWIHKQYSTDSTNNLTMRQAGEIIAMLEAEQQPK